MRVIVTAIAFAGVAGSILLSDESVAQSAVSICDSPKIFDQLPKPPNGCQRELIQSSGGLRPTEGLARGSAEKEWRRQVITKYGERFQSWANAACRRSECVPGAIAGLTRCTVSAIPCAQAPSYEGSSSVPVADLTIDEVKEMQRRLGVNADGLFGPKSVAALQAWQRRNGFFDDGAPTRAALEALRKAG